MKQPTCSLWSSSSFSIPSLWKKRFSMGTPWGISYYANSFLLRKEQFIDVFFWQFVKLNKSRRQTVTGCASARKCFNDVNLWTNDLPNLVRRPTTLCPKNAPPGLLWRLFRQISIAFHNPFTAGKPVKFPTKRYITFSPHLKYVAELPR